MPTLFISYKRGTSAVALLMEQLKKAHYRLWFDRDDIHLGDSNWQERIDRGIQQCDALILCLSPDACKSEPVQYEVQEARKFGKTIFPLVLEKIDNWADSLIQIGLTPEWHTEDFTDVTQWDAQIERLLADLELQGFPVTQHSKRELRGTAEYERHQRYLNKLVTRIGSLSLASINPESGGTVQLEDVYIDSPTELSLSLEVKDWHIVDWWIQHHLSPDRGELDRFIGDLSNETGDNHEPSLDAGIIRAGNAKESGFSIQSLEAIIGDIEAEITAYREAHPDLKADEERSWRNDWKNGTKENYRTLHIQDVASACQRLVVLGQPGSGKSTFVKHLALCLAGEQIAGWERDAKITHLQHWVHSALTPIYIELRHFVASKYFPADINTLPSIENLLAYIQHEILGEDLADYMQDLKKDIEGGHALIILDGLDEVPYPEGQLKQRQAQITALGTLLNSPFFAKSRVIVASRPYAYEGWLLPSFTAMTITDFTDEHRIALARRLYSASGLSTELAEEKAEALNQQLSNIDPQLKDRPLFLTLMATVYLKGESEGLPTRRGALYRESILLLLDRWTQSKTESKSLVELLGDKSLDDLYKRLSALAYDVHSQFGEQVGTPEIDEMLLYKHLKPLGRTTAAELIPYLSENAGILVSPGQDEERDVFHFAHRTFQEYLAADYIASLCLEADSYSKVRELIVSKEQTWRVPCSLIADVLADTGRKSEIWALIGDLLENEPPQTQDDSQWWAVWLAGTIALEQDLHLQEKLHRHREQPIKEALVDWLLGLINNQALPLMERADCGRILGSLGDPRRGVGILIGGLPDIAWGQVVSPGNYKYGKSDVAITYEYVLAQYPVTCIQYQAFIESVNANEKSDWWKNIPENVLDKYKTTRPIHTLASCWSKYPNHPCDSANWYQCIVFCRWITTKYREMGLLETDWEIRLPTEQEWGIVAYYPDGISPNPRELLENINVNMGQPLGQTHAVGIARPTTLSQFKVYEMFGNISEHCLNKYDTLTDVFFDLSNDKRVTCGGSFDEYNFEGRDQLLRTFLSPYVIGRGGYGFRLCKAPINSLVTYK